MTTTSRRPKAIVAVALVLLAAVVVGIALNARGLLPFGNKAAETTTTETTAEATTAGAKPYVVDFEEENRLMKLRIFTDGFKGLTPDSYKEPSNEAKDFYLSKIEVDGDDKITVNRQLLVATVGILRSLGCKIDEVKPSEICGKNGVLTDKGVKTLKTVKSQLYKENIELTTTLLTEAEAKSNYNSEPGREEGVVYASKRGIKAGNMACWCFRRVTTDIDSQFEAIYNGTETSGDDVVVKQLVRCGNVISENPPKKEETPTTTARPAPKPTVPTTNPPKVTVTVPDVTITMPSIPDITITIPTRPPKESTTWAKPTAADPGYSNPAATQGPGFNSSPKAGEYQLTASRPPETTTKRDTTTRATTTMRPPSTTAGNFNRVDNGIEPTTQKIPVVTDSHDTPERNAGNQNGSFIMD